MIENLDASWISGLRIFICWIVIIFLSFLGLKWLIQEDKGNRDQIKNNNTHDIK